MPPEQESKILHTNLNRSDNGSVVHAEPSCSSTTNNNVINSSFEGSTEMQVEHHLQSPLASARLSIFLEPLHPVTLKVCYKI